MNTKIMYTIIKIMPKLMSNFLKFIKKIKKGDVFMFLCFTHTHNNFHTNNIYIYCLYYFSINREVGMKVKIIAEIFLGKENKVIEITKVVLYSICYFVI